MFWASYVLLWLIVVVQGAALLLVLRHFGLAAMSTALGHSRDGLGIGSEPPAIDGRDPEGARDRWTVDGRDALLYFAAPGCEPCQAMAPVVNDLARHADRTQLDVVVVAEGGPEDNDHMCGLFPSARTLVSEESGIFDRYLVRVAPFAFVVRDGHITAKGVCSSVDGLAGMLSSAGRADVVETITPGHEHT
jgi:methylamine dehydrogenase accessory protein MauD